MKRTLLIALLTGSLFFAAQAQNKLPIAAGVSAITVKFYPNPATSFINFEFSKATPAIYTIQVYNFMGRRLFEQVNPPDRMTINLTDYTRGVYIYQLRDRSGRIIESGKFQVSK